MAGLMSTRLQVRVLYGPLPVHAQEAQILRENRRLVVRFRREASLEAIGRRIDPT
jgi:hypothetical protein